MGYSLDLEVQGLLASWGYWALSHGNGLGYKSPMAMLMRGHVVEKRKTRTAAYITDDEALKVERLITILCKHKPLEGKILLLKYVERMSDSSIAKHYLTPLKYGKESEKQVSSYQAAKHIANAEGFITGLILNKSRQ